MELKDTIEMMNSADYKERFKAEYQQTKIRYEKLKAFNTKIEAAKRTEWTKKSAEMPKFDCPAELLREQQSIMGEYLHILEVRAEIEGIDLEVGKKLKYTRLAENKFFKNEETDHGTACGSFKSVTLNATDEDIAEAKGQVVDDICDLIRNISNTRDDFFIINNVGDEITIGAKLVLPTVKSI